MPVDSRRLEWTAAQFAARVREEDPADNAAWLDAVTDERDRYALLYVLAAAVQVDRPWSELVAWAGRPAQPYKDGAVRILDDATRPQPCGTRAAYLRHKANGETPDEPCVAAAAAYERARVAARKAAQPPRRLTA